MFRKLFTRRRGGLATVAAIGIAGATLALSGTAGAQPNATALVGSGSQTAYSTMQALDQLFNTSPGCDLTQPTSDPLPLNCGTTSFTAGATECEQGFTVAAENPYNDYAVEAPPVGSGNGEAQLEQGTPGSLNPSYGRSSSGPDGQTTQNFIAYATDGVSWVTFTKVSGTATDQAKVDNLTQAQVQEIWKGDANCSVTKKGKTTNYTQNWICVGAKDAAPIDCYTAQTASGTYKTFAKFANITTNPAPCDTASLEAGDPGDANVVADHENLFENQMSVIAKAKDAADAIYFMSFGKFTTTCPAGKCIGATSDITEFGELNGITASQSTIQGSGGGVGVTFPLTRYLYNVYNNGTAASPATPATQAALNYIGEQGFLCKSETTSQTDPITGVDYRGEIESAITGQGFFPIDVSQKTFAEGSLNNPDPVTDPGYSADDGTEGANGFCLIFNG